ncbi:MAG: hypothetical protein KAU35_05940 [candidate division Zixibacteria bacterium]|nr:hypothetical protein [candidate division Zixibacteria bacterium]
MRIELVSAEQSLHKDIESRLEQVRSAYEGSAFEIADIRTLIQEMGKMAHQLHMALKGRGHKPNHHKYMIKNRDMPSDDPEFYMHVHPVEDLLAFIKDPHANDDPEDQTIGHEFTFVWFSKRRNRSETNKLTRTETGWDILATLRGPCNKAGRPFLYSNFTNDMIHYPAELEGYLEWLWVQASEQGLPHEVVQEALEQLANWVEATSHSAPSGGVWEGR